ncbi:NACHT domain-containing protein [Mitsuaria sp. BK037]|uniref:NACHT domain-containing protein n=1 Tax=Mitsuaria sp. BK037 TaxID=2587122 RepID=UPI00160F12A0|nr:NACHT domain-containing protein [Mitsuaria sp. BK037]MBB3283238.1 hypothetical protein [Mitsuaria sp. BK037]
MDVFIGATIDVASEVCVYWLLLAALAEMPGPSAVLANFEVGGRQVDFAVCTAKGVLIIEAKSYRWPVDGKENGLWTMTPEGGPALELRNAYRQTLDAKNSWKDAVGAALGCATEYPDACVMAAFGWPAGSSVPSTAKVQKAGPEQLPALLQRGSSQRLTMKDVEKVAASLRLTRVAVHADAVDEGMAEARSRIDLYIEQFRILHEPVSAQLVDDQYDMNDALLSQAQVKAAVLKAPGGVALVLGPSGCGKSLLLARLAIESIAMDFVPLLLQAQDFEDTLKELIEREVALLSGSSARQFVSDVLRLRCPVLLCIDGYNECPERRQEHLTRAIRALARRLKSPCVMTTSREPTRSDLLDRVTVKVRRPSGNLKARIAQAICGSDKALGRLPGLLDAVGSGLEAKLVGEVFAELGDGSSTFALFDTFVRKVLAEHEFEGVAFLARFAGVLAEAARFSTSVRETDRLLQDVPNARSLLDALLAKRVLARRGDRMSFGHEQFFRAALAEWAARTRMGSAKATLEALKSPRLGKSRVFLLGAIENEQLLCSTLPHVRDFDLLLAADAGQCGVAAQTWVRRRCIEIIDRLQHEASVLTFERDGSGMSGVTCVVPDSSPWTEEDRALLSLVAKAFYTGRYLPPILKAIRLADAAIVRALATLRSDIGRAELNKLSANLFSEVVLFGTREFSLSQLIEAVANGHYSIGARYPEGLGEELLSHWTKDTSSAEAYVLMSMLKRTPPADVGALVEKLVEFFKNDWRGSPYHLKLQSFDLVEQLSVANEGQRRQLRDAVAELKPTNMFLQHSQNEAMHALGAFDDVKWAGLDDLMAELKELSKTPTSDEACAAAAAFYMRQFDSPYGDAHYQAWHDQLHEDRALLSAMACRSVAAGNLPFSFPSSLIRRAAEAGPTPYVLETIRPWLELPSEQSSGPQESIESLVAAHEAYGEMGQQLPQVSWTEVAEAPAHVALLACARLFYVASLPEQLATVGQRVQAESHEFLKKVGGAQTMAAIATLHWGRSMTMGRKNVPDLFPAMATELARDALASKVGPAWFYERHGHPDAHMMLAIQVIGRFGGPGDLHQLSPLVDDVGLGEAALDAIRDIEARQ